MKTWNLPQEVLVEKVRHGLEAGEYFILPLTELAPVFSDEDHRFERVLELHRFAVACDADCEMASDVDVRFHRKHHDHVDGHAQLVA